MAGQTVEEEDAQHLIIVTPAWQKVDACLWVEGFRCSLLNAYGYGSLQTSYLVHSGCYNQTPQAGGLSTTEMHYSQSWRLEV